LHDAWMAETKEEAEQALISLLININQAKTEKHFSLSMTFQLTFLASSNY